MIVDDIVSKFPMLDESIKKHAIVRVPWSLEPIDDRSLPDNFTQKSISGAIDWDGIRLPYEHTLITSSHNEKTIILFHQHNTADEGFFIRSITLTLTEKYMLPIVTWSRVRADGSIGSYFYHKMTDDIFARTVEISTDYEKKSLEEIGLVLPSSEQLISDRLADIQRWKTFLSNASEMSAVMASAVAALFCCKNVEAHPVDHDPAIQRKRVKRGLLPLYRYHVLKVLRSMGVSHSIASGNSGDSTAIHWVRGHFKQYTAENPLFGKHTGLYWWQPHLAGQAPRVVEKEYAL